MRGFRFVASLAAVALLFTCSGVMAIAPESSEQLPSAAFLRPGPIAQSAASVQENAPEFVPGEVIVKFRSSQIAGIPSGAFTANASSITPRSASVAELSARYGLRSMKAVFPALPAAGMRKAFENRAGAMSGESVSKALDLSYGLERVYKLEFDENADVRQIAQAYAADPDVEFAQPNYIYRADLSPNDYYYNTDLQSPPIHSWGQPYPDLWGIKQIDCEQAWDLAQGLGVTVAVIDTGVDWTHPDLAANIWTNTDEIPGNGVDDDGNGYRDDVHGWNFCNSTNSPMDDHGHGTHCSGTIAAVGNNSTGVIGVAPRAKIMALKFLGSNGSGSSENGALAMRYAANNSAKVLSNSWGADGATSDPVVEAAIDYARSMGCVVVVSAGNSNHDVVSASPAYYAPAVTVAALDYQDRKAYFSNYGAGVDVSAPGVDVLSLRASGTDMYGDGGTHVVGSTYYRASGTSMACPHVAGAVAEIMSYHPSWTNTQVEEYLTKTCDCIDDVNRDYVGLLGYGRINVSSALLTTSPRPSIVVSLATISETVGDSDGAIDPGETVTLHVKLKNLWLNATGVEAVLSSSDPLVTVNSASATYGTIVQGAPVSRDYSFTVSADAPYGYLLSFDLAITANGDYSATRKVSLTIPWPVRNGWPKNITPSSITPVDVDDDGVKEVVTTAGDTLAVYNADGTVYSSAWPKSIGSGLNDPSIGDIDGDGLAEIVLCSHFDYSYSGKVYAYKLDGTEAPGFPVTMPNAWDISQAVLADIDPTTPGLELALTVESYNKTTSTGSAALYVLKGNGQTQSGWPFQFGTNADPGHSDGNGCVAVGDIDNDGKPEILAGAYYWGSSTARFYAFSANGQIKTGWPCTILGNQKPISVVIGDLDKNGSPEIVLGAWTQTFVLTNNGQLYSPAWNSVRVEGTSLALGDTDGDGDLEIAIGPEGGWYYAYHHNGLPVGGWPVSSQVPTINPRAIIGAMGDLDGDGRKLEIAASSIAKLWVFEPDGMPMVGADPIASTSITDNRMNGFICFPSIADLTGEGELSLLGGICETGGYAYVWNFPTFRYTVNVPWPMQGHDPQRTGCYTGVPPVYDLMVGPLNTAKFTGPVGGPFTPASKVYKLFNTSSAPLDWSATPNQPWMSVSALQGTIPAGGSVAVTAWINSNADELTAGDYAASVAFTNLTTGSGSTSRAVALAVRNGVLDVSPTTGLATTRLPGGQISPSYVTYTLANTGFANLTWSAAKTSDWVSVSPSAGTLQPGKSTTVTVSILPPAGSFTEGVYTDTVTFTNVTNGYGNTTRGVTLTISAGYLAVTPSTGLLSIGEPGGPFDPSGIAYTLQNTGYGSISWTAAKTQSWMSLSGTGGTLAPGASVVVTASVNSDANSMERGVYPDTLTFTNTTNSAGSTARAVSLVVGKVVYVDKNCAGTIHDGKSWATAYTTISAGLNVAVTGQEVWVAGGNYGASVTLKSGVVLKGGYAASGGLRDINAYTTTITTATGADSSTLDGFTIAGTASRGVYCNGTSPTIINNTILNDPVSGSSYGVYCEGAASAPIINANRFANNEYAILCEASGPATITNNIINGNYIGIKADNVAVKVINNLVNGSYFGMSFYYSGSTVNNNIVCNCSTGLSGDTRGALPTLSHNDFYNNGVDYTGVTSHSTDIDADPLFANPGAGDFHIPFDSPCVDRGSSTNAPTTDFDGNPRPVDGNGDGSSVIDIGPYETQWTTRNLLVTPSTGLVAMGNRGGPFSPSSIIYTVKNISGSSIVWTASNTQSWLSLSAAGSTLAPNQTATLAVSINSNAATLPNDHYTDTVTFTDLTTGLGTVTRTATLLVGAVYVNNTAGGSVHDGVNWDTAFLTVQAGIDAAVEGQEVWVAQGTYLENDITISKNITLKGGFSGIGATRDIDAYVTTVQAPATASRVFMVKGPSTIDGLTISGNCDGVDLSYTAATVTNNTFIGDEDSGVDCYYSTGATIANNKFVNKPRGVSTYQSSPTVIHNTFTNCWTAMSFSVWGTQVVRWNKISGGGTGINSYESNGVTVSNNLIAGCSLYGIRTDTCPGSVTNNTIVDCGKGVYCYPTSPNVSNNIIAYCGTGIYKWFSQPTMALSRNNVYGCSTPYYPATMAHTADISVDPLFFNRTAGDYHLLPGSGCIDRGDSVGAPTDDLDGNARPKDGDGNGTAVVDIGCYECPDHYVTLARAKALPDGVPVGIACSTSTAVFDDRFYVENTARICGIGVLGAASAPGRLMQVEGAMSTSNGERVILSSLVREGNAAPVPLPFHLNSNALGGGRFGLQAAVQDFRFVEHVDGQGNPFWTRDLYTYGGANNIGLLVKAVGKVSALGSGVFYLDAAASFDDGNENTKGIAVVWPFSAETMPPNGATVSIVAISSCQIKGGIVVRMLRPVSSDAVMILKPPDIGPGL